jgi:intracellular septation protein
VKIFLDMFPIIAFFAVYAIWDIYAATAAVIVACFVQTFGHRYMQGKYEKMHVVTLLLGIVFGGATLLLRDPDFIKAKPTIIYAIFAVAFLGSQLAGKRTMVERMLGKALDLPAPLWRRLNVCWVAFFAFSGYANIFVADHFSERTWVAFKTFGDMGLMLVFVIAQLYFLRGYIKPKPDESSEDARSTRSE